MTDPVTKQPVHFRTSVARAPDAKVSRHAGVFDAGLIEDVSIITRGEALGHNLWVDQGFLSDVAGSINASSSGNRPGMKTRFTHPGLSSDGVGQKLGRVRNARVHGDQVLADLHFQHAATKTPDGDLADYVMTLAEETPEDFGISVVFDHDMDSVEEHTAENTEDGDFTSPDELNTNNFVHAQLAALRSADVVDSPAANPDGLFKRGQEAAIEGEQVLEYALGLSDVRPNVSQFSVDPDRLAQFVSRFLERHQLSLQKGGETVSDVAHEEVVDAAPTRNDFTAELNRYVSRFGSENGTKWFMENVSFTDALEKQIEELDGACKAQAVKIQGLESRLESLSIGEDEGGDFAEAPVNGEAKERTFANRIKIHGQNN